jgi:anti-sigma B factor antagonist
MEERSMILEVKKHQVKPGVTALQMKGSIHTGPDCRRLEHEVDELIREGQKRVIFDVSGLTHIDSAAIGSIIRCLASLKKSQGDLRLAGATGMLEGTLKLTKVDRVISLFPTVTAASEDFVIAPPREPS